jgi:glutamate N-acetyltransferase/amino-acid N-acetyltransferase
MDQEPDNKPKADGAGGVGGVREKAPALHVPGFRLGAAAAGLKKGGAWDVCVVTSDRPCAAAGVFTRNCVTGEPVKLCRRHLRHATHRAIVANAKVSNVCTGWAGQRDARAMAAQVAEALDCSPHEVFVASTGVIGALLPMDQIRAGICQALAAREPTGWEEAARAIMTTDTFPKTAQRRVQIGSRTVTLAGMAKGSGMIHPNMATLFCFVLTDAAVEKSFLQEMLGRVADRSLNCTTVDGDTSTSDTMLVLANGAAGNRRIARPGPQATAFEERLQDLCVDLARQIARDGEGAEHLITVRVDGTRSDAQARRIAHTIATSPLVKTAIYGRDANWGRIAAAAGRAGVAFSEKNLTVRLNDLLLFEGGQPVAFDEAALTQTLSREEIAIDVSVGRGDGRATVWTCDLTDGYIRVNAHYRT